MLNLKKITLGAALFVFMLPQFAQAQTRVWQPEEKTVTVNPKKLVFTFYFIPCKDMFYVPWGGNGIELKELEACVEEHKNEILSGKIQLHVDGWSRSAATGRRNRALARTMSNRVKSELITNSGLREEHFITKNHVGEENAVVVRIGDVPFKDYGEFDQEEYINEYLRAADARAEAERRVAEMIEAERREAERRAAERRAAELAAQEPVEEVEFAEAEPVKQKAPRTVGKDGDYNMALRLNLLRWATLTPDLGFEWRLSRSIGVLVNGSYTTWSMNAGDKRYALWEVAPEIRYYLGKEKRGYVGAMYKMGDFNYKISHIGKQGSIMGYGLTGGYQLRLTDALSMDFTLGVGMLKADYKTYTVEGGQKIRQESATKDWYGPINAGVTLVWQIFKN